MLAHNTKTYCFFVFTSEKKKKQNMLVTENSPLHTKLISSFLKNQVWVSWLHEELLVSWEDMCL